METNALLKKNCQYYNKLAKNNFSFTFFHTYDQFEQNDNQHSMSYFYKALITQFIDISKKKEEFVLKE